VTGVQTCALPIWCTELARQVDEQWISDRQEYWLSRLPREHPNLRVAVEFCLTEPGEAEAALRILVALPPAYLWARDLLGEGRRWLDRLRSLAPSGPGTGDGGLWARGLVLAAQLAIAQGDLDAAGPLLAEGRQLARRHGEPAALAFAGYASACTAMYTGDFSGAVATYTETLALCDPLPTLNQRLDVLVALAIAAGLAGEPARAIACHEEIVSRTEPLGELYNRSTSLWALGLAYWRQGDDDRATELQQRALRLKWDIDDRLGIALSMEALAWVAAGHDAGRAATLLGAAEVRWHAAITPLGSQQHLVSDHDDCVRSARAALGDAAFEAACDRGRRLSPEEALAYAVGHGLRSQQSASPPALTPATALTRREHQVAELVGQGLSNQDIADVLVISRRTAESHVENILSKLGFRSRTQIAAWVVARRRDTDSR